MSYAGERLIEELKDTEVCVAYGIDRNAKSIYSEIDVVTMEDNLSEVDVVVVTPITFLKKLKKILKIN